MENETYAREELEIAHAILRYLSKNPDAGDTLEGIAEWWLLKERIDREVSEIERAVSYLVHQGLVIEKKIESRKGWFQINKERFDEIFECIEGGQLP